MKKSIRLIIVTLLLFVCSGCFIPVEDGGYRGGGEHDRGGHRDNDRGEQRDHH
jgi:hypothetical protein